MSTSRVTDATATKTTRRLVAAHHHGQAGAALLRPGETTLSAQRITEHGRTARPATRAAAKAHLRAVLDSETDQNRGCDMRSHVVSEYVEEVD